MSPIDLSVSVSRKPNGFFKVSHTASIACFTSSLVIRPFEAMFSINCVFVDPLDCQAIVLYVLI